MKRESLTLVTSAITSHRCLEIEYPPGRRVVAPHILGRTRDDEVVLSAYQIDGASETGQTKGWKTFHLDRITHVALLDEKFSPQPDYNPRDPKIATVIMQL